MSAFPRLVNKQFNSPIKLYSTENVTGTLNKQTQILSNGAVGIDFSNLSSIAPGNLANSAVLKMLEEEERLRGGGKGLKRVEWPPLPEDIISLQDQPVYSKSPDFTSSISSPLVGGPITNQFKKQAPPNRWQTPQQKQQQPAPPQVQTFGTASPTPVVVPTLPRFEPPPTLITLRQEQPVSQAPPPIFASQPAAVQGPALATRMRGDEKWPPVAYKAQAEAENEERKALTRGPVFRPRRVNKDYSKFFAQHAIQNTYPGYRAPPGTQHYIEEGTSNY